METKNFFFYLVVTALLNLTACESFPLKTRTTEDGSVAEVEVEVEKDASTVEAPEFLQKEIPKLGLILGGGGALSYASIGFLQELENNKIPVHAIAGVEWGALVAGAYALENKAHGVEWKLLKLPTQKFQSKGFFSSKKQGAKVSDLGPFLNKVFANSNFSDLEIPFTCSFSNLSTFKNDLRLRGRLRNAVRSCWPRAPHFVVDLVGANPMGVVELSKYLRNQGADLIIYVDVESSNNLVSQKERVSQPEVSLSWLSQRSFLKTLEPPTVDEVVRLPLAGHQVNSYKSLRSIIRTGQLKSKSIVKGLAQKYAF